MQLRPYQENLVSAVLSARERGCRSVMAAAPTGTGKTVSFVALHQRWPERTRTLVLAHREELLEQAAASFQRADPGAWIEIEQANRRAGSMADVVIASVQTVGRPGSKRLDWLRPGLVICDECHHACAPTYRSAFARFGAGEEGGPFLLGVTATPKRLDRLNLHQVFQEQVYTYTIREAITDGWLCDIVGYRVRTQTDLSRVRTTAGDYNQGQLEEAVDVKERTEAIIGHWREVAGDRPTIVFCAGVDHAEHFAEALRAAGYTAETVSGRMDRDRRREAIDRFKRGQVQVLTNVDILTEGFDHPPTSCVVMARPTQSWALYVQCVGRGTRLAPGKRNLVVIDAVDNCDRHSLATVPAILDLPAGLDLQGHSLREAAEKLEELGEKAAALESYQPELFSDLETMLEQVDLFAAVAPPAEATEAGCRLAWVKLPGASYHVSCGPGRDALLERDMLGVWTLTLREQGRVASQGRLSATVPPPDALWKSDQAARRRWPESERLAATDARWRQHPPTDKQVRLLRRYRISEAIIAQLDRGGASAMITQCQARGASAGG